MLMPKKVKFRKQQRGRMRGKAVRGSNLTFGEFGLQALEPCWLTARQIEAGRITITRHMKRRGKHYQRLSEFYKGFRAELLHVPLEPRSLLALFNGISMQE